MQSQQTFGSLTLIDEEKDVDEGHRSSFEHERRRLQHLLSSLDQKLEELIRIDRKLFEMMHYLDRRKQEEGELNSTSSPFVSLQDEVKDPVLAYRLSLILDFLKRWGEFEKCGVFLLSGKNARLECVALLPEDAGMFRTRIEEYWKEGKISPAIIQKRRMVLPVEEGSLLIIPFRVLDEKEGFWVAHLRGAFSPERRSSADLFFWVDLMAGCMESHFLRGSRLASSLEDSPLIEAEKLFNTAELSQALVYQLNDLLQTILSRIQLLKMNQRRSGDAPSTLSLLETIEANTNQINSILKNFSDYLHRLSNGALTEGEVNFQHILKNNLTLLKCILEKRRIEIEFHPDFDFPLVNGDAGKMEQALLSLIRGIRDSMSSGGNIRLETSSDEDSLHLNFLCVGKDDFQDPEVNRRFMLVSQIIERQGGGLECEKLGDAEMKCVLKLPKATFRYKNMEISETTERGGRAGCPTCEK